MLEKIDQLSSEVSNIIIYSRSAILQNLLTKKIKDRFKIEKYRTVYVDTAAELKAAKSDTMVEPFGGGMWYVTVNCDRIPFKDLEKALGNVTYAAVNVYWTENYSNFKKLCDMETVKRQGVFCFKLYTGRLAPEDILYIHNSMVKPEKRLSKDLLNFLKKNYTYNVNSICTLFDRINNDIPIKTTGDIINEVGIGGNTIESFVIKLLTSNPKTDKGLKKAVESLVVLYDDLSYSDKGYSKATIKNFIKSTVDTILEIKQLQIMGKYSNVIKNIPEKGFHEEKIKMYKRFERVILEDINIARVLKLKLILSKYNTFSPEIDILQSIHCFLSEIKEANDANPESKEFSGKKRRRKY